MENKKSKTIIKKYESLQLHAYYCPAKVLTIGYGHTGRDVLSGMQISENMAELLLDRDIAICEKGILPLLKVDVTENQFSALVSFVFNVGVTAFKDSTLLKRLNNRDTQCADEFDRWIFADGKKLNGLIKRRQEEKELFLS